MPPRGEDSLCSCGRAGVVNLQCVGSMVRDIREPCLHSAVKSNKILKPEKWQTIFDTDGKIIGFRNALKLIVSGGVDPSIRPEVWEFLLGCYSLSSTSEYRSQLRMARRDRYDDLIRQCQTMHSSIGTGELAYVVGSKLMDVRVSSKDSDPETAANRSRQAFQDTIGRTEELFELDNDRTNALNACNRENISNSKIDTAACSYGYFSRNSCCEIDEPKYDAEDFADFPPLWDADENEKHDNGFLITDHAFRNEHMRSFQINNNVDLIRESNPSFTGSSSSGNNEADAFSSNSCKIDLWGSKREFKKETAYEPRMANRPEADIVEAFEGSTSGGLVPDEKRASEWLWTLHRIAVDVVRTDNHLEFYGDSKNIARMSDILAVYAWVDPATGYCQGMSDLLSPFLILYENNADAFWCFEMLLRRMRENFQMEGPTGVMKQLEALWRILELTDAEISEHLSDIGAESLHFAFRMLLVLFRRELSFDEALCMWEMMWAADFDEAENRRLEENCLEALILQSRCDSCTQTKVAHLENSKRKLRSMRIRYKKGQIFVPYRNRMRSITSHPLCGLRKATFLRRHEELHGFDPCILKKKVDVALSVFCVASILISNRQKILRETHSIDDVIKMFNDNVLKFNVRRCVRMAIKLRKYFYKLNKQNNAGSLDSKLPVLEQ